MDSTPRELASITLAVGESGVCTFVNNDVAPRLTLKKQVRDLDGNLTFSADWTLLAGGSDSTTPINGKPAVAADGISALVTAGVTYTLGESGGPAGYTNGDDLDVHRRRHLHQPEQDRARAR